MEVDNGDPNQLRAWSINLMDLDKSDEPQLPNIEYKYSLFMKSTDFKNIVQDAKAISAKNLKITYNKGNYTFHAKSDIGEFHEVRRSQKVKHEFLDDDDDDEVEAYVDGIYTGQFDIERLTYSTKCTSVSKYTTLNFENDSPLIVEYDTAVGTYRLYLSPVDDDED
jgi:DNA polymerase III sliding clamp (beta) subunit (PCNA family)